MGKKDREDILKESLKKNGQLNPIIKDAIGLTLDGLKRKTVALKIGLGLKETLNTKIKDIDSHIEALKGLNPSPMSRDEKEYWAKIYYQEYKALSIPDMKIYEAIAIRLGVSKGAVRNYLSIAKFSNVETKKIKLPKPIKYYLEVDNIKTEEEADYFFNKYGGSLIAKRTFWVGKLLDTYKREADKESGQYG